MDVKYVFKRPFANSYHYYFSIGMFGHYESACFGRDTYYCNKFNRGAIWSYGSLDYMSTWKEIEDDTPF